MTVNGIGTHYYGKKNRSVRTAACASCHRVGSLESYDTRLWFVVVFIPVIPLGRKRIIDQCPVCRRHFVAGAAVFEQNKQLQISGSLEHFRREPSAEAAASVHQSLVAFREFEQAAQFRNGVLPMYPDNVGLRVQMAQQLRAFSSNTEAFALFEQALALDPDHPEARAGVALARMTEGKLDEARPLLDFLEEPGAGKRFSLQPIDVLARCYQGAGRHDEVLQLAEILLREYSQLGNDHSFRAFVRKSEKKLGRGESVLPAKAHSLLGLFRSSGSPYAPWQRVLAIGGLVSVLLIGGLAINNEYIRRHRVIHVVNACGTPALIQIDDEPAQKISGLGKVIVAEGPHTIKISGPVQETHNVQIATAYFDRWFQRPAWILDVGGEAVLEERELVYGANPRPSIRRLIIGETFVNRPNCDYIFEDSPARMEVRNGQREVVKKELKWIQGHDVDAFHEMTATNHVKGMEFAEHRLGRDPVQPELLQAYLRVARVSDWPRLKTFLKSGIERRPVNVTWHRYYQELIDSKAAEKELTALYDRYLAANPADGAVLYLRGRIEPDWKKEETYFGLAIKAAPRLAWPWYALAWRDCSRGNWDDCLTNARKAKELNIDEPETLSELIHMARLGKGEADKLVPEYRSLLRANTTNPWLLFHLVDALVITGKANEVDAEVSAWLSRLPVQVRSRASAQMKAFALYQAGNIKECRSFCSKNETLKSSQVYAQALLADGIPQVAANDQELAAVWKDPWNELALSLAFSLSGKAIEAEECRSRAVKGFREGEVNVRPVADLLTAKDAPAMESLSHAHAPPYQKVLLAAALAEKFPAKKQEYLALAKALNLRPLPPYYLVRRAVEQRTHKS
jgi:tetratricopeptide (TPR) repeat protein